jgi:hypothetical protein
MRRCQQNHDEKKVTKKSQEEAKSKEEQQENAHKPQAENALDEEPHNYKHNKTCSSGA